MVVVAVAILVVIAVVVVVVVIIIIVVAAVPPPRHCHGDSKGSCSAEAIGYKSMSKLDTQDICRNSQTTPQIWCK